LMKTSNRLI